MNGMIESVWTVLKGSWGVGANWCRSLQSRQMEAPGRWFPRLCGRRLVSADSSPLTVKGELELTVVFPGLSCVMLFVVASIGSDGLLSTEALQLCLPHQLDLRTGQLWADGRATLQFHQQKTQPKVRGIVNDRGGAVAGQ